MSPAEWAASLGIAAGAVTAFLYLAGRLLTGVRFVVRVFHAIDAAAPVILKELQHNSGSSMKDDMHGLALSVGDLQRRVGDQEKQLKALTDEVRARPQHSRGGAW